MIQSLNSSAPSGGAPLPPSFPVLAESLPLGVMVRSVLEWLIDEPVMAHLGALAAPEQYTRELTLADLVGLMIQVAAGTRASLFAAYQVERSGPQATLSVSHQAVYEKLGRMNPAVPEALVRYSAERLGPLSELLAKNPEPLEGYRALVIDGNVLGGSEHRLKVTRRLRSACLPGKSLVSYEVATGLTRDLVLCEDAYRQERALVGQLLPRLGEQDLVLLDRNFCTTAVVFGLVGRQARFIVRQHRSTLHWQPAGKWQACGQTASGRVRQRWVRVSDPQSGQAMLLRQVEVHLFHKTRDGERVIRLLSNLPEAVEATTLADAYLQRWTVEKHFQMLTDQLHCEQPGLGKPRAALFAFAMALLAANALAIVRAALRSAHGAAAEQEVSNHYLADEMAGDYRAVMKLLPAPQWIGMRQMSAQQLAGLLIDAARHVPLQTLRKHPRGPKKPWKYKRLSGRIHKHRSTARLLHEAQTSVSC